MDDRTLQKIALVGSFIGLMLVALLAQERSEITAQIDQVPEGQEVKVTGIVDSVRDVGKVVFLTLAEQKIEKTHVVLFKSKNMTLDMGSIVSVTGTIDDYNGEKQVIGNRIELKKK